MDIPVEFTPEAVAAASDDQQKPLYRAFHESGEPNRSLLANNPWLRMPRAREELEWGEGWYYDTTVARKHPHWSAIPLPQATKNATRLRHDLRRWGYCLIEDGVSAAQTERLRSRIVDQAGAERALGIAHLSPAQQHVWALVNKGADFVRCMTHDPEAVQAGPLIEQLLDEAVGSGWNHLSFISNISYPGCHPQGLHQDQTLIAPYHFPDAPLLVNTIYVLQDIDEVNGGTLVVPGSHRPGEGGSLGFGRPAEGAAFGAVPHPINLEARAGTIVLLDGRVLHGGAVNHSDELRYIITNSVVRPWIRQQENFLLTVSPEVLANASAKFLRRTGFQATAARSMVEGYGYFGNGKQDDPNGSLVHVRRILDEAGDRNDGGGYHHVGELSPDSLDEIDVTQFSLWHIQQHETNRNDAYHERLAALTP